MNYAKIKLFDAGKAMESGERIRNTRLKTEKLKDEEKDREASNLEQGNFLIENYPDKAVQPVDSDKSGDISDEERKNAVIATGRKYKAWDKIRDDKEIAANRAATQGRARRAEARQVERHNVAIERNRANNQEREEYKEYMVQSTIKSLGVDRDTAEAVVKITERNEKTQLKIVMDAGFEKQVESQAGMDALKNNLTTTLKTYSNVSQSGKPEDIEEADKAAVAVGDQLIKGYVEKQQLMIDKDDIEGAKNMSKIIKKLETAFKKEDGKFNYQGVEKVIAGITRSSNELRVHMQNGEDIMEDAKTKRKGKDTRTADQKNAASYEDAKDTPQDKRSSGQQYTVDKAEGKLKSASTGKQVTEEIDDFLGIQEFSSKEEKAEATKLKIKALKFWKKDKTLTAFEAREKAVAETEKRSGNSKKSSESVGTTKNKDLFGKTVEKGGKKYRVDDKGRIFPI